MARSYRGRSKRIALNRLIDGIFDLDEGVRFVAVYLDQYMLAGGMRPGLSSFDPDEESREVDLQLSQTGEIAQSWQKWFGQLGGVVFNYENLNLVFQPLAERKNLVLSTEPSSDPASILERLRDDPVYTALAGFG